MNEMVDRILDLMQSMGLQATEDDASRIIAAMREPTRAMVMAGKDIPTDDHEEEMWQAMIDAALSEEVKKPPTSNTAPDQWVFRHFGLRGKA